MTPDVPEHRKAWEIFKDELPDFGDATKVPSVSGVIAWAYGSPPDVPAIHVALDRGSKVHLALQLLDERDLHLPSVNKSEEMMGYIAAWREWTSSRIEMLAIEKPLYGHLANLPFIVRPDRVMRQNGRVLIVDIKTKSRSGRLPTADEQLRHGLEVAAQRVAVSQRLGLDADLVACAYVWPDKLKIVEYGRDKDIDDFAKILIAWHESQAASSQESVAG
jgi:hypothetical protein